MKIEDLPVIAKRELARVGWVEGGRRAGCGYTNFHLLSFKKVDTKWHITADFEEQVEPGRMIPTRTLTMALEDATGDVTEMSIR